MTRNEVLNSRLNRRELLAAMARIGVSGAALSGLGALGLNIAGCSGSSHSDSPISVNRTGRFYSADSLAPVGDIAVDIGRTFVDLVNGVPVSVGWELPERAIKTLPQAKFDVPDIYFLPLPPEADATPFKFMAFSNWSNGHKPVGTGDAPHIHPVICIAPPGAPTDDNVDERMPVQNPDEIPEGYVLGNTIPGAGDTIASGIGQAFEYPSAPQLQPHWNTTAQNYFFYRGHLNGIGMGASYDFLNTRATNILPVTQPKLHPKAGWYPTKNITTWDDAAQAHVFVLTDFIRAVRWI